MADSTTEFKPYIPADKITPEFTLTSILTGVILAIVVFGGDTVLFPSDISVAELYSAGGASAVWSKFIRYIGAGAHGMVSAITIGSIICIIAAIAGDTSQDLKTGFLLGATPKKQYRCLRLK